MKMMEYVLDGVGEALGVKGVPELPELDPEPELRTKAATGRIHYRRIINLHPNQRGGWTHS